MAEDFRKLATVGQAEVGVVEGAGGVGAGVLGEVDQIDRRVALFVELGDFFLELGDGVFELERDRALVRLNEGGGREELLVVRVQFSEKKIRRGWRTSAGSGRAAG